MKTKRTLVVVDLQNDFAHPGGALYVKDGETIIDGIIELIQSGDYDFIVTIQDWHPENHYSFKENDGQWPRHCIQHSWGAQIISHLLVPLASLAQEHRYVAIFKGTDSRKRNDYSGFSGLDPWDRTPLAILLKNGITDVDIVGLALDFCVKYTAIDAVMLGFKTRVLLKYTKAVNLKPNDDQKAIKEMKQAGIEIKVGQ